MGKLKRGPNGLFWEHTVIVQENFPDNWQDVRSGRAFWKSPLQLIGDVGLCYIFDGDKWRRYNPEKPWKVIKDARKKQSAVSRNVSVIRAGENKQETVG